MNFKFKKFFFIALVLLFSFFNPQKIYSEGQVIFSDDFEDGNSDGWVEYNGGSSGQYGWSVIQDDMDNYVYEGTVVKDSFGDFPSYTVTGDHTWTDYSLELKLKGIQGKDKVFFFRYSEDKGNYGVNIVGDKIVFAKNPDGFSKIQSSDTSPENGFIAPVNGWHKVKIIVKDNTVKIYLNNVLQYDFIDNNNPILSGGIRLEAWPGNYGGIEGRTTVQFDDIVVKDLSGVKVNKVVFLPGLSASWNTEAMVLGHDVGWQDWDLIPFAVPVYKRFRINGA